MARTVRLERFFPFPTEQVWHTLTDADTLGSWFMPNDFEPVLHQTFTFHMKPQRGWDGITYCEVIDIQPFRCLAYSYRGKASGEKTLACAGINAPQADAAAKGIFTELDTVLQFTLTPARFRNGIAGTRLVLEHSGFKGLEQLVVSFVMGAGWRKQLHKLSAVLDSQSKHTVSVQNEGESAAVRQPV